MSDEAISQLTKDGVLRAGINLGNRLLVTGEADNGDPDGVSPDMARAIAEALGAEITYVPYPSPGVLADAAAAGEWDIGLIAAEPSRAETIAFTAAYVEIEATYLVPAGSTLTKIENVDSDGIRIAVSGRSAYDLYLSRNLKHAELIQSKGISGAVEMFLSEKMDALAGLRPALVGEAAKLPGSRILDGQFTSVQQAMGVPKGRSVGAAYLSNFVEGSKASGMVASLIDHHGVTGRLSVAQPA